MSRCIELVLSNARHVEKREMLLEAEALSSRTTDACNHFLFSNDSSHILSI